MGLTGANVDTEDDMFDKLPKGKWCDVNGDTILEFDGKNMHVTWWAGDVTGEDFKVKVKKTGYLDEIVNTDTNMYGESFGMMSSLTVRNDGTLTAYEQILDAEGHSYIFVPEEILEAERAVKDFSTDLPKQIESDDLKVFQLGLTHYSHEGLDSGNYSFSVEKTSVGKYVAEIDAMGDSYIILRHETEVDEEYVKGLVELVKTEIILSNNGAFFSDREGNIEYSLYVTFESHEKVSIRVGNTALDRWCVDNEKFMEYALKLVPEEYLN